ncbi:MAG: cell wall-binding repeat-containing protein [bacterium]|nr:cell wall-binding repeat-containing protein [bacterium]
MPALASQNLVRVSGSDRFTTSVAISMTQFPTNKSASAVVLASGRNFPDALAGVSLAAVVDGPLLLSEPGDLTADTRTELQRVLPTGATVYVLGGDAALSATVENAVSTLGYTVHRIASATRYGTATGIAAEVDRARDGQKDRAYLVSGASFADALSIAPRAAQDSEVLLLNPKGHVATEVNVYLDNTQQISHITIIGGTAVISDGVIVELNARGITVDRIAGADRYQTGKLVADLSVTADMPEGIGLANGENYPDALSAGSLLASLKFPLLLAKQNNVGCLASGSFLYDQREVIDTGFVFGGTAAISTSTENYAEKLIDGTRQPGDCDTHDVDLGNDGIDKDCSDFGTRGKAQAYFEQDGGSITRNVDDLDADHDGLACEWLPE